MPALLAAHNPADMRLAVLALDEWLREMGTDGAEVPMRHDFLDGIYARTMFMRKGMLITSKWHLVKHTVVVSFGKVAMTTNNGIQEIITAPCIFTTYPGTKRALYALEDTVWTTYHKTDFQDVDTVENTVTVDDTDEADRIMDDRHDYERFLIEYDLGQDVVDAVLAIKTDMELARGASYIAPSPMHGSGVFVSRSIAPDEWIASARIDGKRLAAGRYVNHSFTPNAQFVLRDNGDIDLVAISAIDAGHEVFADYRNAMAVNGWGKQPNPQAIAETLRQRAARIASRGGAYLPA